MPANFTLSSGASFSMRDQTIGGDTGNHTISGSYNKTPTAVKGSHNTKDTADNGTYAENYYSQSKHSNTNKYSGNGSGNNRYSGLEDNSNHNNTYTQPRRDELPSGTNINYRREQHEVNPNYGLPLYPGCPLFPPNAPEIISGQLPPSPQSHSIHSMDSTVWLCTPPTQSQAFQPFTIPDEASQPSLLWAAPSDDPPTHNLTPQETGLDLDPRPSTPRNPNDPINPIVARIESRATSPAMSEQNSKHNAFETPRTEPGMTSPLQLRRVAVRIVKPGA
ncbi:hypothetical protein BDQ17DRAFT_1411706 [Cyathus striatus]|nr:hypothetical protein BDQ17DRAFT_1411706 [Cyathus striatus]